MGDPIRVLHVDDDAALRETVASLLEREDARFSVETVESAVTGEARLADGEFDCVVSDYDMPGVNGIEFLERVREVHPELPFILFTGKGSEAVASDAISAGVTEYLQKRAGTEQYELLAHRIKNAVAQHQTVRRAETLDRVRTLVADVSQALVRASSRKELETSVCEIISEAEPYQFAWIGAHDADTGRIKPRTSVGIQSGYLDEVTITADDSPTGQGPAGRAIRNRRVAVSQNVGEDPRFERWREAALDRGFRSAAGVPLIYDGTTHGVLVVYADRVDAFDDTECDLLAELGDSISHAIHSILLQDERARTNSLLSTLLDLLPVGVLAEDTDRNVLAANRQLFELFGLSGDHDAVVGTNCERMAGEAAALFVDPEAFVERIDELIAAGEPVDCETLSLEDGRTLDRSYQPIELPQGAGHLWVYRNMTDRLEREREHERRTRELEDLTARLETQYRYLFEEAPVMAVVTRDVDGEPVIEECDTLFAETLGYGESDVIGRPLTEFYTADSRDDLLSDGYERALEGEFTREYRELVTADGGVVETLLRAVPRRDEPFETAGTLALYVDITERERLKRERDRLEEFSDIVSHDLRNPLNVASGRLELARAECDSEHLDAIEGAHERMNALIENLLAFARSDTQPEGVEATDLAGIAETCWRNVDTGTATLETNADLTVEADRSRLEQLLENLIRNAVEHGSASPDSQARQDAVEHGSTSGRSQTGDGVTVTVGALEDGDGFFLADDGSGIPPDARSEIFESGYSTANGGTGLGLAIVERIAAAHGWTVEATESETGGARFEIRGIGSPAN